jgi:hypothetical protein
LITGITLTESINSGNEDFKIGVWCNVLLFLAALSAYFFAKSEIADVLQNPDAVLLLNIFAGFTVAAAVVLVSCLFFKFSKITAMLIYIIIGANMMWVINNAAVFYQEVKKPSTKKLAETINLNRRNGDLVFCYKRYYQDFPVYLNSTVGVVDFLGELEFGAEADPQNDKLITEEDFWKLWNTTKKRIFLLLSQEHYREVFAARRPVHRILDFDKYFTVIVNR